MLQRQWIYAVIPTTMLALMLVLLIGTVIEPARAFVVHTASIMQGAVNGSGQ